MQNNRSLVDRIDEFNQKIKDLDCFYEHNEEVLDIYEGNLLPYVEDLMCKTLDARYYAQIQHRILPVNFSQKIVDKLSKSYAESPIRSAEDQEFVDQMTDVLKLDSRMGLAEEYSYLNRGYALKPKLTNSGKIKMDVLPYDKFCVFADDPSDKLTPTVFIEFLGKTERQYVDMRYKDGKRIETVDCYIAYSDTEIIGFDSNGDQMLEVAEELGYLNPIGCIPFVYGNRSVSNIIPKQDTDFLKLNKILPLMLSDINGAIMFQCFTLIYGIDIQFNDAEMNPNAIWDLSTKSNGERPGSVGTLQPSVDSDKALSWFKSVLAMWLDTKGIDAGSIMQLDSQDVASGLAKAMEQLDTTEARKKSITMLAEEEKELFILLAKLNNYWIKVPEAKDLGLRVVDVDAMEESYQTEFKEPMPKMDITTEINNSISMLREGLSYREKEIKRLHPYATEDEINQIFFEYGEPRYEIGSKEVEEGVEPKEEEPSDALQQEEENQEETDDQIDGQEEITNEG